MTAAPFTRLILGAALFSTPLFTHAQGVGIGTTAPNPSAALDISSTSKGLLLPRLSLAQRDALTANTSAPPVPGLVIYQTDNTPGLYAYDGAAWLRLGPDNLGNHTATQNLNLASNQLVGGTAASPGTSGLSIDGNGLASFAMTGTRPSNTYNNGLGLQVLDADAGFLVRTAIGYGNPAPPMAGQGDRLMWTSYYSALRAGGVDDAQWDGTNLGFYSAAFGYNNIGAGNYSLTSGYNNTNRGSYSSAFGAFNFIDLNSVASTVFGNLCRVKGNYSLAVGINSLARGRAAIALGERCTANADYAIVLGRYASAATRSGSFTVADASINDSLRASANNQFSARYAGGYRFYTNSGMTIGVSLASGGNAWTVISDSTKKELRRLADGNQFLARLNRLQLGSWNYKGQDPGTMRHYGPMAQDFFNAFGHDALGTIGNDTTINQADFDGVNLIAIQALYRRVLALEAENAALRRQQSTVQANPSTAALEERLRRLETLLGAQAQR